MFVMILLIFALSPVLLVLAILARACLKVSGERTAEPEAAWGPVTEFFRQPEPAEEPETPAVAEVFGYFEVGSPPEVVEKMQKFAQKK